jgi:hypothetical protein
VFSPKWFDKYEGAPVLFDDADYPGTWTNYLPMLDDNSAGTPLTFFAFTPTFVSRFWMEKAFPVEYLVFLDHDSERVFLSEFDLSDDRWWVPVPSVQIISFEWSLNGEYHTETDDRWWNAPFRASRTRCYNVDFYSSDSSASKFRN